MKDKISIVIPTVNLTSLANNNNNNNHNHNNTSTPTTPTSSSPTASGHSKPNQSHFEYDGCQLCVNGTPCCLQKRRATWTLKLRVALYCLSVLHPEKKYFNLKKDIYTYVDSHWDLLSVNTAKSDRWRKQVQDSLSHCRHFESGWDAMGCNGHWRLIQPLNPWTFPPEREAIIDEEETTIMSSEAALSPRAMPAKSPREDPLYRNFPKRKDSLDESECRKRKVTDMEMYNNSSLEEDLLNLKYSPMIFSSSSETPSPKCRTPNKFTTSPSIVGNSPMMTSTNSAFFSLSNFNNNLNLNTSANGVNHNHSMVGQTPTMVATAQLANPSITVLDFDSQHTSPVSSPIMYSEQLSMTMLTTNPPIPALPFSWKSNSTSSSPYAQSSPVKQPQQAQQQVPSAAAASAAAAAATVDVPEKFTTLPNPFAAPPSPKFSTPSPNFFTLGATTGHIKHPKPLSLATAPIMPGPISKIEQQNLILNCTF
ncbi:hypothetical protein SAMD00019534_075590 [Acytostelium subglobosum LB1]|uniref:hypothetical protein n=1 Tax=Acytostelium subglobosum LB1 TaxID=1410327 RepID=UPI0006448864|nr:hypothetical protein SAMD00019534_075590 [Acytostelium subglobosum LB1]GAM24384.1 hypothetical protein SAMD00019534_075590 [Acytostelium subglobosum LB1]|eukprot:XP_012752710.1 hypothetical protein SAMD00019534_075590 [Acytostelium subglobosum LB1]